MIGKFSVAGMPIVFDETTLEQVRQRLGGTIGNHGDAGDALAWLCFRGEDETGPWIFWLTSGELYGLSSIDGFTWRRMAPSEIPDHRCRTLPKDSGGISLPVPLRLGLTKDLVRQMIGRPTRSRSDALFFLFERQRVVHGEQWTVYNSATLEFQNGGLWIVEVNKSTTN
jgi:hypothetical protein